jgi:hypothetical protein
MMAVRQGQEQFPLNKGGRGRRPWGLLWSAETEYLWRDWIPAFAGMTIEVLPVYQSATIPTIYSTKANCFVVLGFVRG